MVVDYVLQFVREVLEMFKLTTAVDVIEAIRNDIVEYLEKYSKK